MSFRVLLLWNESFRSEHTKKVYNYLLDKFMKWCNKDHESLLMLTQKELEWLLQDYAIYLKKRISPNSFGLYFAPIEKFLVINDKGFNTRKLHFLFPETVKPAGERAITTEELQRMLQVTPQKRGRALIHLMASTGARPEALSELILNDVTKFESCTKFVFYAESKHEHTTFAHEETTKALNEYLEERRAEGELLKPETYVFRKERFIVQPKFSEQLSRDAIIDVFRRAEEKAGIKRKKLGQRYDLAVCTGIRKRFNTILKKNPKISYSIAEMFMDHTAYLEKRYTKPSDEELFEEYKKAISDLVIDDKYRLRAEIEAKNEKIRKGESEKDLIITELARRLNDVEKILRSIPQ